MKKRVLGLFQPIYKGCNHQHFIELLVEIEKTVFPDPQYTAFCLKQE